MIPLWSTLPESGTPLPPNYMNTANTRWLSVPIKRTLTAPGSNTTTTQRPRVPVKPKGPSAADIALQEQRAAAARAAAAQKAREQRENEATKKQVDSLKKMLDSSFGAARDAKLTGIDKVYQQSDALLLSAFQDRLSPLSGYLTDNEKSEHDATQANLANRARERGDIIANATGVGVGETDLLRAQLMAARNWGANQQDVNRAFFDTQRSINSQITDLNQDTKQSRFNLSNQANKDRGSVWDAYYNQVTDTWNQIANLEGSNSNESYKVQFADANDKAATAAASAWNDPGVSEDVQNWKGRETTEKYLNNSALWAAAERGNKQSKRPEGATLRTW